MHFNLNVKVKSLQQQSNLANHSLHVKIEKFDKLELISQAQTGDDDLYLYSNATDSDFEDGKSSDIRELDESSKSPSFNRKEETLYPPQKQAKPMGMSSFAPRASFELLSPKTKNITQQKQSIEVDLDKMTDQKFKAIGQKRHKMRRTDSKMKMNYVLYSKAQHSILKDYEIGEVCSQGNTGET
ncbi:UNKNOWN [Stylonychia lemnae]|uniref:Uncharacterized protein n=1 Tax=Stylonychia lemnae TaxID=5949 RepID=A0A078ABI9_STYLE|nr:UNKNOWN [Stylonychia lemnae]|eukprot:CDW79236.1 UNKNOWN [Stylonychia lemnae]